MVEKSGVRHEEHFESMERQKLAATLGMWVFLASEILFFGALFTMFASYRAQAPEAFTRAVQHNTFYWGSGNTLVLLTSSFLVALAVHMNRHDKPRLATVLVYGTVLLGVAFLCIKGFEYAQHFNHGIFPGGQGHWFEEKSRAPGMAAFWNLYYLMTGLHALHVTVGIGLLGTVGFLLHRRKIDRHEPQTLENAAMYWHLVDIIWLFLWPCFYLTNGSGP